MSFRVEDLSWTLGPEFSLAVPALEIPRGKSTLLLGPSGSGKSTLLKLLGRVEGSYFPDPTTPMPTGAIHFSGLPGVEEVDLMALSERELLRRRIRGDHIGLVFQREGLFSGMSVRDNVRWPLMSGGMSRQAATDRADAVLERVSLRPDRDVTTLSGGERKRLALARTLGPDPSVLLMDEPFTGLDPRSLEGLLRLAVDLASEGERTLVMVTHQRADIDRLGDHVVLMSEGQIAAAGDRETMTEALDRFLEGSDLQ